VLQRVAVCCSVLQCVALRCSVVQCVADGRHAIEYMCVCAACVCVAVSGYME